jgi:hypothetical protein
LLSCSFFLPAMVARREAVVMHSLPFFIDSCLLGAMEALRKSSFERNTRCQPATPRYLADEAAHLQPPSRRPFCALFVRA